MPPLLHNMVFSAFNMVSHHAVSINRCWHYSCWGPISPKVSTQVSFYYDSWICFAHFLSISIPSVSPSSSHLPPTYPPQLPSVYCLMAMRWVGIVLFLFVLLSSRFSCCLATYLVIYFMFLFLISVCEPSRAGGNGICIMAILALIRS